MLRTAPKFYEVAKRIVEMTEDCIIVAHNSEFDYRILRTEFSRLGFEFKRKTLCTVELAKEIMPEQESYSLGKLTRALGIPVSDRHRASGDAIATVKLFKMLLAKDLKKKIIQEAVKDAPKYQMRPNLKTLVEDLPAITGLYYLHDIYGKIIYLGKSKNIKNRVNQHFTNPRSKKLQKQVAAVTFEATGNELIATLKENAELSENRPPLNRSRNKIKITHGLCKFVDDEGLLNLKIETIGKCKNPVTTFSDHKSGKQFLEKAVEKYNLRPELTGIISDFETLVEQLNSEDLEFDAHPEAYNERVKELIDSTNFENRDLIIIDKGRAIDEHSVILIENGVFAGMGFYNLNYQITNRKVLESIITPMESNVETKHIIHSYLRKNNQYRIVELN